MNKYYTVQPCINCGASHEFSVDIYAYGAWQDGTLIQNAFPDLTIDQRETLMTGRCATCQDLPYNGQERKISFGIQSFKR